jgi:hypothetical protein
LIISDFLNNRIRIADFQTNKLSTLIGNGQNKWSVGVPCASLEACASVFAPLGVGISPDDLSLYMVMNSENAVGKLSNPLLIQQKQQQYFDFTCQLKTSLRYNAEETCNVNMPNSKSCMLYKPLDVIVSKTNEIYVSVTQGITQINLNNQKCQQIGGSSWNFDVSSRGFEDGGKYTCTHSPKIQQIHNTYIFGLIIILQMLFMMFHL